MSKKFRRSALATVTALALSVTLAACSQTDAKVENKATTPPAAAGGTVAAGHNAADTEFAQMMIVHHQGALEMAQLATDKATNAEVKALAERITGAQQPEIDLMTGWLASWGEDTGAAGGMDHAGMEHTGMDMNGMDQDAAMANLAGLEGRDFDRQFLALMTAHHEGAIDMAELELKDGKDAAATGLAGTIIDDQAKEISEMGTLEGAVG